ncbi:helix-turn-helix transcriptional regulator [Gordonia alkaliphila]|uniref:Helix-turn-helix domain-containing protein n=1 Tax=Gordonia alkaliphila TaxID=1053547 RepID=A0ABP8Z232_9ACTN|nr:helix-turn-helix domain-containing protein [Gordonia alkaliphila]MCK0438548.1 helix-turn-helix transcriptional regulator [Gordonia alkaliphila]
MPPPESSPNAIARGLGVLGDEWCLQLLRAAHSGATRFGRFQEELPISAASLAARLALLADEGLFIRRVYQQNPIRAEYLLTPQGRGTWPILLAIWDWEDRWADHPAGELPDRRHAECGQSFHPELVCATCGVAAGRRDVTAAWGPTGGWDRSIPDTATRRRTRASRTAGEFPETMAVFGNRWSAVVIGAVFQGIRRYSEFESLLGIPSNILSERLRILVEYGLLRVDVTEQGRREYHLTEKGRAFFPIVATTLSWAERWFALPEGPAISWQHGDHPLVPRLDCDQCHRPLQAAQIEVLETSDQKV